MADSSSFGEGQECVVILVENTMEALLEKVQMIALQSPQEEKAASQTDLLEEGTHPGRASPRGRFPSRSGVFCPDMTITDWHTPVWCQTTTLSASVCLL